MGEGFVKQNLDIPAEFIIENLTGDPTNLIFFLGVTNENTATTKPRFMEVDNDFIYVGGEGNYNIQKIHKENLVVAQNSSTPYNGIKKGVMDNDFIYVGGSAGTVAKYHKSNLTLAGTTNHYGGPIESVEVDNDFIYAVGFTANNLKKWHKGNLVFVGNTPDQGSFLDTVGFSENFVFTHRDTGRLFSKFHKGNLGFVDSVNTGSRLWGKIIAEDDDDFLYMAKQGSGRIDRYYISNLFRLNAVGVLAHNQLYDMKIDNEFIYVVGDGGEKPMAVKLYKENLQVAGATPTTQNDLWCVAVDNDAIYVPHRFTGVSGVYPGALDRRRITKFANGTPDIENGVLVFKNENYLKEE